jgi:hypothetical protein
MKRLDWRIIIGSVFILGGVVALLEKLGVIPQGINIFWGMVWTAAALAFLYVFVTNMRTQWWTAIPGFTLLGMGLAAFLPNESGLEGLAFLGGIGLAFWAVYLANRASWWAIIPGGVMVTLGLTAFAADKLGTVLDSGGVFFLGLGLTFLLVGLLAKQNWAYIPATVLFILGVAIGLQFQSVLDFVWIGLLFLAGIVMVVFSLRRKE